MEISEKLPLATLLGDEEQYRRLRRVLITFCHANGSAQSEDDAAETIRRMWEKETAGVEIEHPIAYAKSVAWNVLREKSRERQREAGWRFISSETPPPESLLKCLERCQKSCLSAEERRTIQAYYAGGDAERIKNREKLARKLKLTPGALKTHVFRIRKKLEPCVKQCWEEKA